MNASIVREEFLVAISRSLSQAIAQIRGSDYTRDHDPKERKSVGTDRNAPDDPSDCSRVFQHDCRRLPWHCSGDGARAVLGLLFCGHRHESILLGVQPLSAWIGLRG